MLLPPQLTLPPATIGELEDLLRILSELPAGSIARVSREISGRLYSFKPKPESDAHFLNIDPRYAWVLIFHHDGFIREAALKSLHEPPTSPFFVAALAWRLNDWAIEVRRAAQACFERVLSRIDAGVAATAALDLLVQSWAWGRWRDERQLFHLLFARPDVIAALADTLCRQANGKLSVCLRTVLRHPGINGHLPRLAQDASQPAIRAIALRCLITGKATWLNGFSWTWINKIYGVRRRVPVLVSRDIVRLEPAEHWIERGLLDRSSLVRWAASDELMKVDRQLPNIEALIGLLEKDRSPRLRTRAEFLRQAN